MKFSKNKLEQIFADDFSSPVFPILAEIYFQNKEYERSMKVCKIGLSHNSNNAMGNYILSKIYFKDKKYEKAESILKKIIQENSHHVKAIIELVKVQKQLKRSSKKIQETISLGLKAGIENQYFQASKRKNINKKKHSQKHFKESIETPRLESVSINKSMATKTMYEIMIKQKKYDVALSVLYIMQNDSKNVRFANKEMKKIKNLLNQKG